jgi:hypothetical protein
MAADRPGAHQKTIGADKNYDTKGFVAEMRRHRGHAARGAEHRPQRWLGHRWPHHPPRGLRQVDQCPPRHREGVWLDQTVGLRQFKLRGTDKVSAVFGLHVIAYNLIRLGNMLKPAMAAA